MSSTSPRVCTGVAGFRTTPTLQPWARISSRLRFRWRQASWWTEIQLAPASAKAGMNSSGFSIIRWQSSGTSTTLRNEATTGGPMVKFGTKWPSITSQWMTVAPPRTAASAASPKWAKSADNMDGASSIKTHFSTGDLRAILTRTIDAQVTVATPDSSPAARTGGACVRTKVRIASAVKLARDPGRSRVPAKRRCCASWGGGGWRSARDYYADEACPRRRQVEMNCPAGEHPFVAPRVDVIRVRITCNTAIFRQMTKACSSSGWVGLGVLIRNSLPATRFWDHRL